LSGACWLNGDLSAGVQVGGPLAGNLALAAGGLQVGSHAAAQGQREGRRPVLSEEQPAVGIEHSNALDGTPRGGLGTLTSTLYQPSRA